MKSKSTCLEMESLSASVAQTPSSFVTLAVPESKYSF